MHNCNSQSAESVNSFYIHRSQSEDDFYNLKHCLFKISIFKSVNACSHTSFINYSNQLSRIILGLICIMNTHLNKLIELNTT